MNGSEPAFPFQVGPRGDSFGINTRLYVATAVLQGLLSDNQTLQGFSFSAHNDPAVTVSKIARRAVQYADALLVELEGDRSKPNPDWVPSKVPEIHPGDCTCPACEPPKP